MRVPIFNLNNKSSYKDEYTKILKVLSSKCITYGDKGYTYFDYVNTYLFHNWNYRGTYLDCYEYLEFIGVNVTTKKITEDAFLNFIEFLLNMQNLIDSIRILSDKTGYTTSCRSILFHNLPIILEDMGYKAYSVDNKIMVLKKDIDYEDLYGFVPDDIYELILSYNTVDNNGIKMKRIILNKIYDYMLSDIEKYKTYNSTMVSSIKLVINKMGVVGNIDKKYAELTNYKMRKYYDYCFSLMTYLIRTETMLKYRDELREI